MKLCYNEATAKDCSSLPQDLVLCEQAGFDYIEIRIDMLNQYLKEHTVLELAEFFRKNTIKPYAFNALYIYDEMYSDSDIPQKRRILEEQFLTACRVGREIGDHHIIVVPPLAETEYTKSFEEAKENCIRILEVLACLAEEYEMKLCFELVGLKRSSVRTIRQAREIVEAVGRSNVGYVFDAYNVYSYDRSNDFSEIKTVEKEKIFAVHINNADDCPQELMSQDKRRFCDQGVIRLENFLSVFKEIGYEGIVSIETFRPEYWSMRPEQVIASAYGTTRAVLEKNGCYSGRGRWES